MARAISHHIAPPSSTLAFDERLDERLAELELLKPRLILLSALGVLTLLIALLDGGGGAAAERRVLCASFSLFAALIVFYYRGRYRDVANL